MHSLRITLWRREDKGTVLNPQAADIILCPAHPIQEQERRTPVLTGEGWCKSESCSRCGQLAAFSLSCALEWSMARCDGHRAPWTPGFYQNNLSISPTDRNFPQEGIRWDTAPGTIAQCRVTRQKDRGTACLAACKGLVGLGEVGKGGKHQLGSLFLPSPLHCCRLLGKAAPSPGWADPEHHYPLIRYWLSRQLESLMSVPGWGRLFQQHPKCLQWSLSGQ